MELSVELNNVATWAGLNNIPINETKSKFMLFGYGSHKSKKTVGNLDVINSASIKVLGITIDNTISWTPHIDQVIKNQCKRLYLLRCLRKSGFTREQLITVYRAVIESVCLYCCPVFVGMNACEVNRLERLRIRAHRITCGSVCKLTDCYMNCLLKTKIMNASVKLFKAIEMDPSSLNHKLIPSTLRYSQKYLSAKRRTKWKNNSFFNFVAGNLNRCGCFCFPVSLIPSLVLFDSLSLFAIRFFSPLSLMLFNIDFESCYADWTTSIPTTYQN